MIAARPHALTGSEILNDAAVGGLAVVSDGIAVAKKSAAPEHLIVGRRDEWDGERAQARMIDRSEHLVFAPRNGAMAVNTLRRRIVLERPQLVVAGVPARDLLIVVGDHSGML